MAVGAAGGDRRATIRAIIAGGGIGGLTTALMLHARGIDCQVYEQAPEIRELGVGINTLPHAIRELKEVGLLDGLDAVGIRTHELIYMNRFGQEVWREPRGLDAGIDVPQFSIHRGALQGVIHRAVSSGSADPQWPRAGVTGPSRTTTTGSPCVSSIGPAIPSRRIAATC